MTTFSGVLVPVRVVLPVPGSAMVRVSTESTTGRPVTGSRVLAGRVPLAGAVDAPPPAWSAAPSGPGWRAMTAKGKRIAGWVRKRMTDSKLRGRP
jgi:hypothetical protein